VKDDSIHSANKALLTYGSLNKGASSTGGRALAGAAASFPAQAPPYRTVLTCDQRHVLPFLLVTILHIDTL